MPKENIIYAEPGFEKSTTYLFSKLNTINKTCIINIECKVKDLKIFKKVREGDIKK